MLQLFVENRNYKNDENFDKYSLQDIEIELFEEMELAIEYENSLFELDYIPSYFVLPFDIPNNMTNRIALDYEEGECHFKFNGRRLISGSVKLVNISEKISVEFKGILQNNKNLNKNLNELDLKEENLSDCNLNSLVPYLDTKEEYLFAPICINKEAAKAHDKEKSYTSFMNYFARTNSIKDNTCPGVFLCHLFDSIFEEHPFVTDDFKRILIQPFNYSKKDLIIGIYEDLDGKPGTLASKFSLKYFMPHTPVVDLVKQILTIFGFSIYVHNDKIEFSKDNQIFKGDFGYLDWSDKILKENKISSKRDPLTYKYGYDTNIDSFNITKLEVDNKFDDIIELSDFAASGVTYITKTKDTYQTEGNFSLNALKLIKSTCTNVQKNKVDVEISTKLSPLPMDLFCISGKYHDKQEWFYLPYRVIDEINYSKTGELSIMNYAGKVKSVTADNLLPSFSITNYDALGNKFSNISLDWEGEHGLIKNFHEERVKFYNCTKELLECDVLLSAFDICNLNLRKHILINNKQYLIKKLILKIKKRFILPSRAELIEK